MWSKKRGEESPGLIPGLPDEIAIDCLVRLNFKYYSSLKQVCKAWNSLLSDPFFYRQREAEQKSEQFVLFTYRSQPTERTQSTSLFLYSVGDSTWHRISSPDTGFHLNAVALVAAGKLIVLGGRLSSNFDVATADVYVRDLIRGGGWRLGAPMLVTQLRFAAAVAPSGVVFIAGDRSAEMYDAETDAWTRLPRMKRRVFCPAVFADERGRFWVCGKPSQDVVIVQCYDGGTGLWTLYAQDLCPCVLAPSDRVTVYDGVLESSDCGGRSKLLVSGERRSRRPVLVLVRMQPCTAVSADADVQQLGEVSPDDLYGLRRAAVGKG